MEYEALAPNPNLLHQQQQKLKAFNSMTLFVCFQTNETIPEQEIPSE